MTGRTRALIDFETDRIVWLTFLPAASGSAVARIISASPDACWDRKAQGIDPLELRSPADWYRGPLGTCHFESPLGRAPYDPRAMSGRHAFSRAVRAQAAEAPWIERHLSQERPFVQTTHLPASVIARLFPRCPVVVLQDFEPGAFTLRAYHEKFNRWFHPMAVQKAIWGGATVAEAVDRARGAGLAVELRDGRPLTGLQFHTGKAEPTDLDLRAYYRRLYRFILDGNRRLADVPGVIAVDRGALFDGARWRGEYGRLCAALRLTPRFEEVGRFIESYNAQQWQRPAPPGRGARTPEAPTRPTKAV